MQTKREKDKSNPMRLLATYSLAARTVQPRLVSIMLTPAPSFVQRACGLLSTHTAIIFVIFVVLPCRSVLEVCLSYVRRKKYHYEYVCTYIPDKIICAGIFPCFQPTFHLSIHGLFSSATGSLTVPSAQQHVDQLLASIQTSSRFTGM